MDCHVIMPHAPSRPSSASDCHRCNPNLAPIPAPLQVAPIARSGAKVDVTEVDPGQDAAPFLGCRLRTPEGRLGFSVELYANGTMRKQAAWDVHLLTKPDSRENRPSVVAGTEYRDDSCLPDRNTCCVQHEKVSRLPGTACLCRRQLFSLQETT